MRDESRGNKKRNGKEWGGEVNSRRDRTGKKGRSMKWEGDLMIGKEKGKEGKERPTYLSLKEKPRKEIINKRERK